MTLVEFIGFLISLFAMFVLFFRKRREERRRQEHPELVEQEEKQQEQALKQFLKSLEMDMEEMDENAKRPISPKPTPPPMPQQVRQEKVPPPQSRRAVQDAFSYKTKIEDFKQKSAVEDRQFQPSITNERFEELGAHVVSEDLSLSHDKAYHLAVVNDTPRLANFVRHLPTRRDMLIYQEIMARPKALRFGADSHDYP